MKTIETIEKLAKDIGRQNIAGYTGITEVDCAYAAYSDYLDNNNISKQEFLTYSRDNETSEALYERVCLELLFNEVIKSGINSNLLENIEAHREKYNSAISKLNSKIL